MRADRRGGLAVLGFLLWALGCAGPEPAPLSPETPDPASASIEAPTRAISSATLTDAVTGDVACYLSLSAESLTTESLAEESDEQEQGFEAMAAFEACDRPEFIGQEVQFTYVTANVLADSCQGDPECADSQAAFLIDELELGHAEPVFEGPVGHLEASVPFLTFAEHHAGRRAQLILAWESDVFVERPQDETPFFMLWNTCESASEADGSDEALGAHRCAGIEVQLRDGDGSYELTDSSLTGFFKIGELVGPHQGIFALPLVPVAPSI